MNNRESKLTGFYDVFEEEVEKIIRCNRCSLYKNI
ncbi:histidyl-tRNA synthetase protein HisS [Streptococcus pyogenes]|nr:histidyl-tRNA synthetase protein HisS [Streptococcus pyogenes]VHB25690.1 histidyl-tRNA synthetase protein HisS [Streptococcus pyogenes]VHM45662.1 histidyl-tRNA synthetase protein HisS [Streptococcus pyogenes]